jgi:hypothetical protein
MNEQQITGGRYPLRRSFLERRLGEAVGLAQFDAKELHDNVSAATLAGEIVIATEAPLGTLEFDTMTVLAHEFAQHGDPDTKTLQCTIGRLCGLLGVRDGGHQRRDLVIALARLNRVILELHAYDEDGNVTGVRERHLFQELELRAQSPLLRAAGAHHNLKIAEVADSAAPSCEIVFTDWLATAIFLRQGRLLDLETQRALTGVAKTVWVTLDLLEYVQIDEDTEEHVVELSDTFYEAVKLRSTRRTDNLKSLKKALRRIAETDPTIATLDVREKPGQRQRRQLVVRRLTGEARQRALRARQRRLNAIGDPSVAAVSARPGRQAA